MTDDEYNRRLAALSPAQHTALGLLCAAHPSLGAEDFLADFDTARDQFSPAVLELLRDQLTAIAEAVGLNTAIGWLGDLESQINGVANAS